MGMRRIASAVASVGAGKPGGLRGPSTIRTSAAGSLLSHSDAVSAELVEQAIERFVGLDHRNLGVADWRATAFPPTAEASTDRSACAGRKQGGRMTQRSTDTGSTVAAGGRRGRTRESASPRGQGARRCRAEPPEAKRSRRR